MPPRHPAPVPAATVGIELVAPPGDHPPGGSAQLSVNAVKSDGSTEDVAQSGALGFEL